MENNECIIEPFKREYLEKKHTKQLLRILNNQQPIA